MFRENVEKEHSGPNCQSIIEAGELVNDDLVNEM